MLETLIVTQVVLGGVVVAIVVVVLALARQIGVLYERVAPMGALITDSGPKVGELSPVFALLDLGGRTVTLGGPAGVATLVFFLSPTCPVCKKLLPILRSIQSAERGWLRIVLASDGEPEEHRRFAASHGLEGFAYVLSSDLGITYRVSRLPYGVLLDRHGSVRAKGLVNSREQVESLFEAHRLDVASIQDYLNPPAGAQPQPR
jgi:methylamine dehydrogenase accessory protein MauD